MRTRTHASPQANCLSPPPIGASQPGGCSTQAHTATPRQSLYVPRTKAIRTSKNQPDARFEHKPKHTPNWNFFPGDSPDLTGSPPRPTCGRIIRASDSGRPSNRAVCESLQVDSHARTMWRALGGDHGLAAPGGHGTLIRTSLSSRDRYGSQWAISSDSPAHAVAPSWRGLTPAEVADGTAWQGALAACGRTAPGRALTVSSLQTVRPTLKNRSRQVW
jgi:hypothetical protein